MENKTPVPTQHSSERAFEQIHKANHWMRIMVVLALIIFGVMLAFALITLNRVQTQYQDGALERAKINRQLLDGLTQSNHDTQVLICSIVTIVPAGHEPNPEVIRICGPVLRDPDNSDVTGKRQSFLAPGSNKAAAQSSQPAQGNNSQASQPAATESPDPNQNTTPQQPGLVDVLQQANPLICTTQQILLNRCIVKL